MLLWLKTATKKNDHISTSKASSTSISLTGGADAARGSPNLFLAQTKRDDGMISHDGRYCCFRILSRGDVSLRSLFFRVSQQRTGEEYKRKTKVSLPLVGWYGGIISPPFDDDVFLPFCSCSGRTLSAAATTPASSPSYATASEHCLRYRRKERRGLGPGGGGCIKPSDVPCCCS